MRGIVSRTSRDLKCWQKGVDLAISVYSATRNFPKDEVFGLSSQLRRAAVSVASNIAEGKGRLSNKDSLRFFGNARGSLFEVETQIDIAEKLHYLAATDAERLRSNISETGKMLNGLIRLMNCTIEADTREQ
jgi:four helix bundle protein